MSFEMRENRVGKPQVIASVVSPQTAEKPIQWYLYLLFFAFSATLIALMGSGQRNYLLIGLMSLSPVIVIFKIRFFRSLDLIPISMVLWMTISSYILHGETFRGSTLLYAWMFVLTFFSVNLLLRAQALDLMNFQKFLRWMIFAYAAVLVFQQFSVLAGIPVFNDMHNLNFKLSALASEPSHTARFMLVMMYAYTACEELILGSRGRLTLTQFWSHKMNHMVLISFVYVMVTCRSTTAICFCLIYFLYFINWKTAIGIVLLAIVGIQVGLAYEQEGVIRAVNFLPYLVQSDVDGMMQVDHSGSLRFIHIFILWDKMNWSSPDIWFGGGHETASRFFYWEIPGVEPGTSTGGFLTTTLLDYGLLALALVFITVFSFCCRKGNFFAFVILMVVCFAVPFNTQIFWQAIIFLTVIKWFSMNHQTTSKFETSQNELYRKS